MSFSFERLSDPAYYAENRLPAYAAHAYYQSRAELSRKETVLKKSLAGVWKFFYARNEQQVIPGFENADYDCRPWEDIRVPAHVQMEGHGVPQYANTQYPWIGDEMPPDGCAPSVFNPVSCYVKYFFVPEAMQGKHVFISFEGAESCVALWLNGQYVGFSGDTFTPGDFELTPYLVPGENKLACRVYRYCQGCWLEDQDFFRFSGLYRDVVLYAVPECHVRDLCVTTDLTPDFDCATVNAQIKLEGVPCTLAARLLYGDTEIGNITLSTDGKEASFLLPITKPHLWSSEYPNLYTLELELMNDGQTMELVTQRVGIRRFKMIDGIMYLNGKRIVFKGVNRHDFCAETGRAVTKEKIRRDLLTMKRNNINAVRTCHYPDSEVLYDLCDELGLYLIAENNMESHGSWDMSRMGNMPMERIIPGNHKQWLPLLLDRVNSTYQRDKNHPAILIWSCGNESFGGDVIYEMSAKFRAMDSTRLVHYEGVFWDPRRPETTDMISEMYTSVADIRMRLKKEKGKPFILCEYTHSMGNSNGAMHWYTEYAYTEKRYQGGFIWDFIDQAIRTRDRFGNPAYLYGGDCNDRPNDGNFSGNGIVFADGSETPKMQEVRYNYQDITGTVFADHVKIVNRAMFTPTSDYRCVVTLNRDGNEIKRCELATDVPPLCEKDLPLPFSKQTEGGEYIVTLSFRTKEDKMWADAGHEVAFIQGVYEIQKRTQPEAAGALRIVETIWNVSVIGDSFKVQFSLLQGGLNSYEYAGKELLKGVVMPNFWRAPTDNDRGNHMAARYGQWKLASLYAYDGRKTVVTQKNGCINVAFRYILPTSPEAFVDIDYTVTPDGQLATHMVYVPVAGLTTMPAFGMMLRLDADYEDMRWYGLGPDENYWDRREGARLGIFAAKVKENVSRYLLPQECGTRTGVRWAEVTNYQGRGLRVSGKDLTFSALPYTPHELESALHFNELPPVNYTVLCVSKAQMGVAGDDSWGAETHPEYLLDVTKPLEFTFNFKGI